MELLLLLFIVGMVLFIFSRRPRAEVKEHVFCSLHKWDTISTLLDEELWIKASTNALLRDHLQTLFCTECHYISGTSNIIIDKEKLLSEIQAHLKEDQHDR